MFNDTAYRAALASEASIWDGGGVYSGANVFAIYELRGFGAKSTWRAYQGRYTPQTYSYSELAFDNGSSYYTTNYDLFGGLISVVKDGGQGTYALTPAYAGSGAHSIAFVNGELYGLMAQKTVGLTLSRFPISQFGQLSNYWTNLATIEAAAANATAPKLIRAGATLVGAYLTNESVVASSLKFVDRRLCSLPGGSVLIARRALGVLLAFGLPSRLASRRGRRGACSGDCAQDDAGKRVTRVACWAYAVAAVVSFGEGRDGLAAFDIEEPDLRLAVRTGTRRREPPPASRLRRDRRRGRRSSTRRPRRGAPIPLYRRAESRAHGRAHTSSEGPRAIPAVRGTRAWRLAPSSGPVLKGWSTLTNSGRGSLRSRAPHGEGRDGVRHLRHTSTHVPKRCSPRPFDPRHRVRFQDLRSRSAGPYGRTRCRTIRSWSSRFSTTSSSP